MIQYRVYIQTKEQVLQGAKDAQRASRDNGRRDKLICRGCFALKNIV